MGQCWMLNLSSLSVVDLTKDRDHYSRSFGYSWIQKKIRMRHGTESRLTGRPESRVQIHSTKRHVLTDPWLQLGLAANFSQLCRTRRTVSAFGRTAEAPHFANPARAGAMCMYLRDKEPHLWTQVMWKKTRLPTGWPLASTSGLAHLPMTSIQENLAKVVYKNQQSTGLVSPRIRKWKVEFAGWPTFGNVTTFSPTA